MISLLFVVAMMAMFAVFSGILADHKHRNPVGWVLLGFIFGPFGLIVALLPPVVDTAQQAAQKAQTRTCPECREPIRYDARVCKHCGLRYPYLSEPARTHVAAIADLHREGRSATEIVLTLEQRGLRPAHGSGWTADMVDVILRDHAS
jgi:hypothetical protein